MSESNRKLWDVRLKNTYQTAAPAPTTIVDTCGVWKRGWTLPNALGIAPWRAIESRVLDAGRIVVWADAMPDVMIARITR